MKNSSYITGNRSRDHPACSAVPRPTAPPAACPPPLCPLSVQKLFNKYHAIRVRRAGYTVSRNHHLDSSGITFQHGSPQMDARISISMHRLLFRGL